LGFPLFAPFCVVFFTAFIVKNCNFRGGTCTVLFLPVVFDIEQLKLFGWRTATTVLQARGPTRQPEKS
jgi:hypothetical protein